MDIISRAEANLPRPPSTLTAHTGPWPGITWHHTGGSYTTWRNIYEWQVINRPVDARLPYIGYSYGISNGRVTELRGWDLRPAGDHDNDRLQVCFMGTWDSKLPPAADLAAAQEFLAWATARNGKPLPGVPHRDVWPAGHRYDTDCPGDALTAWVRANLIEGDDVDTKQNALLHNASSIAASLAQMAPTAPVLKYDGSIGTPVELKLVTAVKDVAADVAELRNRPPVQPSPVDAAALKAALLDPEVLAAIGQAVVDATRAEYND